MSDRLKGRVAVVTGSGQGIGRAIAIALAKEGARVVTNNRKLGTPGGDAETTARQIIDTGGQAIPFFGDVSEFDVARKLIDTAVTSFGKLDILVNNTGTHPRKDVWDLTEEDWDMTMKSHLKSTFNCIRHACELMRKQRWGRIINCTSGSWAGTPGMCNYSAAKAGIVGLTWSVARDLGRYGITCNAYHPIALTRRTANSGGVAKKRYDLGLISKEEYDFLCNKPGPEAVGPFVAYLSTDVAADINGEVFYVAGSDIAIWTHPIRERYTHKKEGFWTVEELMEIVPKVLMTGYKNPAPAQPI